MYKYTVWAKYRNF